MKTASDGNQPTNKSTESRNEDSDLTASSGIQSLGQAQNPDQLGHSLKSLTKVQDNSWVLFEDHGPLKDSYVDVRWASYFDDTLENLIQQFAMQMCTWPMVGDGNYETLISTLKGMKAAKIPITNVVALGLGSLHQTFNGAKRKFIGGQPTFVGSKTPKQLAVVMAIRDVLGGMS